MAIILIILIAVVVIFVIIPNHARNVELDARNRFFGAVGLTQMINNCREVPAYTISGSIDRMQKKYTDGVYTVTFWWSDLLRAPANQGREPSFTEPMTVFVEGPDGKKGYSVNNLGVPSMMEIRLHDE